MKFLKKIKLASLLTVATAVTVNAQGGQPNGHLPIDLNKNGKIDRYENTSLPISQRVEDLLGQLTLDEKVSLVMGTGMIGFEQLKGFESIDPEIADKSFMLPGAAGSTYPLKKYGLPAIIMTDGPAGVRIMPTRNNSTKTYYATGFPTGISLASTWDQALTQRVGLALGEEALEYGSDIQLAPALNIMRNPLCGRNYEYFSEDPVVSGKIAAAITRGIQHKGIGVSLKHFAANNSERNRMALNVHVSARTLREIYLRGFEIAVKESNPKTIMSSYNLINGTYTSADHGLLTSILRNEWGFKGLVMTDWFGGYSSGVNLVNDGAISLNENCTSQQIKAGNDLLMPGTRMQITNIKNDLKNGTLSEQDLNVCVRRVLEMIFESPKMQRYEYSNTPDLEEHARLTRQAAAEGMVLLKNIQQTLPLAPQQKNLAIFGSISYKMIAGGTGSGDVNKAYTVSLMQGLENAGYSVNQKLDNIYRKFVDKEEEIIKAKLQKNPFMLIPLMPQPQLKEALIKESSKTSDIAIITLGRSSGEMEDRTLESDYYLTQDELNLINSVSEIYHQEGKKVIVIVNTGGIIETTGWSDKVDALLFAWLPGQEGGNSIADVLSGKVNPSGKLVMTIPTKYEDLSTSKNFQGTPVEKPTNVIYNEGVYVGYRYFDTFNVKPAYEFGYGLSYTTFGLSDIKTSSEIFNEDLFVTVNVKNTGTIAGKEVVQLYLSAAKSSIDKPEKELKAFVKTKLLEPGETQTVYFKISPKDLAYFSETQCAWIADKGTYKILIGNSSRNIQQTSSFTLSDDRIIERVNNAIIPDIKFTDLKP